MKTQIFVSYCREDIRGDDARLRSFVNAIKEGNEHDLEVLVDYEHAGAALGANVQDFMARVETADVVVLILTPGYRSRVAARGSTGVYAEFRRIYDRLLHAEARKTYDKDFLVLPFVFSGTFEQSCPDELQRLHCGDLSWLYVDTRSATPAPHPTLRARLSEVINDAKSRIRAIAATKLESFREEQEGLFQSFLFHDTKSRWDKPENLRYLDAAFVKTRTFLRVRDHEVNFVVGRKGAGKSTITHVLPILSKPRPEVVVRIDFEQLPFEMCFNVLKGHPAEASDLRHAFSPIYSYELLWDTFLHLFFAWQARGELPSKVPIRKGLFRELEKSTRDSNDSERDATATRALFVHVFEKLIAFVDSLMRQKERDSLVRSVSEFTTGRFRSFVFGGSWSPLLKVLKRIRQTGGRALVTVDGFDVRTDYFARVSDERAAAARFESELLLSLFQIVLKTHRTGAQHGIFYEVSDLCVAIPHDRFMQVRSLDRDRYQYRHHFSRVSWSGIELSALVRKRLALLRRVPDEKGPALDARLAKVMKSYPELPDEVAFQFGAAHHRMSLFIYVLRHTFWRPRDVLFFFSALLAASAHARKRGEPVQSGFVRQVIAGATRPIVEDEFISEYASSFRNLREVLSRFRQCPQVMSWAAFEERVGETRFDTPLPDGEVASVEWKAEVLYEIGALGVVLDKATATRFSAFRHAFIFNEGDLLNEKLGRDTYHNFHFALHPVLVEYLHLDTSANPELILPLTWEYLHENEKLRRSMLT